MSQPELDFLPIKNGKVLDKDELCAKEIEVLQRQLSELHIKKMQEEGCKAVPLAYQGFGPTSITM